jgi:hypothetical protein
VLDVVQDEQRPALPQQRAQRILDRSPARLPHVAGAGDRHGDQGGVVDRSEVDEPDAVRVHGGHVLGDAARQAGLADAARPGQRDQADAGAAQEVGDGRDLALPADETRQRRREVRRGSVAVRKRHRGQRLDEGLLGGRRVGHGGSCGGDEVCAHHAGRATVRQRPGACLRNEGIEMW